VVTWLPVLLTIWWLAILHTLILAVNLPQRAYRYDFNVFYASAIAFRHGLNPYTADLMPIGQSLGMRFGSLIHSVDTPTALLFFIPFSFASPMKAHLIWSMLNAAALLIALILLSRPKYSGLSIRMALAIGAIALLYAPITDNFIFSQRQPLILLLLVLIMRSLDKGQEAAAGLLLALAGAYRAFPVLIAGYFAVRRQWRPLIFMGVGLVILGAVTIAGLGLTVCLSYVQGMRFAMTTFTFDPADVALRGFLIRLYSYVFGLRMDGHLEVLQRITIVSAQIIIVALAAWPTYQRRQQAGLDRRAFGLWVAAAIVLSPLSWIHYMLLLLIPFVEIGSAAESQKYDPRALWAAIVSYVLIAMTYRLREDLVDPIRWAHGVRYLAEGSSVALLLGFLAAYWFAVDTTLTADAEKPGHAPPVFAPPDRTPLKSFFSALPSFFP